MSPLDLYAIIGWKTYRTASAENALVKNGKEEIQRATGEAFQKLKENDVKGAMNRLDELVQIGPRVASAIFTFYDPEIFGTMDRFAFKVLPDRDREVSDNDFTVDSYIEYLNILGHYKTKLVLELGETRAAHEIDASLYILGHQPKLQQTV